MRFFAVAVMLVLILLPKTGWIVTNNVQFLAGGYGRYGLDNGMPQQGLVPSWPYQPGMIDDPAVKVILDRSGPTASGRLDRAQVELHDPVERAKLRSIVLRQSFTSILVSHRNEPDNREMRWIAARILPLAQEGEKIDPDNAFFASCEWVLQTVLGQPSLARQALHRAAKGKRYDDGRGDEAKLVLTGIESRHGFRGNVIRIQAKSNILLPQFNALRRLANEIAEKTPLTDLRRRDLIQLGGILIRNGQSRIDMLVGRNLVYRGISQKEMPKHFSTEILVLAKEFERLNPDFDVRTIAENAARTEFDFKTSFEEIQSVYDGPSLIVGSCLLGATILSFAFGIPGRSPILEGKKARLSRAHFAWMALIPAAMIESRPVIPGLFIVLALSVVASIVLARFKWGATPSVVLGGLISASCIIGSTPMLTSNVAWAIAPLLWVSALLVPASGRLWIKGVVIVLALDSVGLRLGHPVALWELGLAATLLIASVRMSQPTSREFPCIPAVLSCLFLTSVGFEMAHDAQVGEIAQRFDDDANRFRIERNVR